MGRGYARLRERNQLTVPAAVIEQMGLKLGDMVEFSITDQGKIEVLPIRIVTAGSPEATREEKAAQEEIKQGRYTAIENLEGFRQHVARLRTGETPSAHSKRKPNVRSGRVEAEHLTEAQKQDVQTLVQETLLKVLSKLAKSQDRILQHGEEAAERRPVRSKAGKSF